jgi:nucleoside permease NupC
MPGRRILLRERDRAARRKLVREGVSLSAPKSAPMHDANHFDRLLPGMMRGLAFALVIAVSCAAFVGLIVLLFAFGSWTY